MFYILDVVDLFFPNGFLFITFIIISSDGDVSDCNGGRSIYFN